MEQRYHGLRVVAIIYRVLAGLVALGTVVMMVLAVLGSRAGQAADASLIGNPLAGIGGFIAAVLAFLYGGVIAVTLWAIGDAIHVGLAIEENTRQVSLVAGRQVERPVHPTPG